MKEIFKTVWDSNRWYRILTKLALFSIFTLIIFPNNILALFLSLWLVGTLVIIRLLMKQISIRKLEQSSGEQQILNYDKTVGRAEEIKTHDFFAVTVDEELYRKIILNTGHIVVFLLGFYFLFLNFNLFLRLKVGFLSNGYAGIVRFFGSDLMFMFWFILIIMIVPYMYVVRAFGKRLSSEVLLNQNGNEISYKNVYKWLTRIYLIFPVILVSHYISVVGLTMGWGLFIIDEYFKQHQIVGAFLSAYFWLCLMGAYFAFTLALFEKCYSSIAKPVAIFFNAISYMVNTSLLTST